MGVGGYSCFRFFFIGFQAMSGMVTLLTQCMPTDLCSPQWPPDKKYMHRHTHSWFVFFCCNFIHITEYVFQNKVKKLYASLHLELFKSKSSRPTHVVFIF